MATVIAPESQRAPSRDEEGFFEIIDGQRVELPPMGAHEAVLAFELMSLVGEFARAKGVGKAVAEVLFHLALPVDRNRRPDGAFVSARRWPIGRPIPQGENAWDVVPELAVEVVCPTDDAADLMEKVVEYFHAGVQLVWVVYPRCRIIHIYESLTKIRVLTRTDELDGGSILPDFRLPLSALFQEDPPRA